MKGEEVMERKYLINGEEVEVIEKLKSGGFLVNLVYFDGDNECIDGESPAFVVSNVFDEAPTQKYSEKIKKLQDKVDGLLATKLELAKQIQKMHDQEKDRLKKYKQYEQLKHLDDFLDGKITHYAELSYSPKIIKFEDAKCEYDGKNPKLLTLFGDSEGNLCWRLNRYADTSGWGTEVVPCTSYEDALAVMQEYIDKRVAKLEGSKNLNETPIAVAKKYNLKINDEYVKAWETGRKYNLAKERDSLIDNAAIIQAKIDELEEIKK